MNREPGYYWVKYDLHDNEWETAQWDGEYDDSWTMLGSENRYTASDFTEIGPRIQPPEKIVKDREPGFYWVFFECDVGDRWEPAEWDGKRWKAIDIEGINVDSYVKRVGPRLDPPCENQ